MKRKTPGRKKNGQFKKGTTRKSSRSPRRRRRSRAKAPLIPTLL